MSNIEFDQDAWFERIGYSGPATPTLETLNRLIFAHLFVVAAVTWWLRQGLSESREWREEQERGPEQIVDAVEQAVVGAQTGEPRDDIALLALTVSR